MNSNEAEAYYHDQHDDWHHEEDSWSDGYAYYHDYDDGYEDTWWDGGADYGYQATTDDIEPVDDEKYKEAKHAEHVAESLALEAQRTWADAQRATQALRRDRGFGASSGKGTSSNGKCFACGGNHFIRDCPMKGKGKQRSYMADVEDYVVNYVGKGKSKGKGKGKGKSAMWLDAYAAWKGKGKSKSKGKDAPRTVNAYHASSSHYDLNGLELTSTMEMASATSASRTPEMGMLDCGATASAAPEAVVKDLIGVILSHDKQAVIEVDQSSRPYFRFGDGRWGRALYRLHISSDASGQTHSFAIYALPNPAEYYKSSFDKNNLVPILIGMDFLGKKGQCMIVDFATGLFVNTHDTTPEPERLHENHKGHFMLDLCHYITRGNKCLEGHARVVVLPSTVSRSHEPEVHVLELHPVQFDLAVSDVEYDQRILEQSRQRLLQLHSRSRQLQGLDAMTFSTAAASASMCRANAQQSTPTTSSSTSLCDGGARSSGGTGDGFDIENFGTQGKGQAIGSNEGDEGGSERSQGRCQDVALLRTTSSGTAGGQQPWTMATLREVRFQDELHSKTGLQGPSNSHQEPGDGGPSTTRTSTSDGRLRARSNDCEGYASQGGCRGSSAHSHPRSPGGLQGTPGAPQSVGDNEECDYKDVTRTSDADIDEQLADGCRPGHDLGESGERLRGDGQPVAPVKRRSTIRSTRPMSIGLGNKVMNAITLMATLASTRLVGLHLGDRDGLWEVTCAPHSWLSQAAESLDLRPRVINLHNGYDLYKAETWDRLRDLRRCKRPGKIWFSLPCTKWCPWNYMHYKQGGRDEQLETARRKERRMLWHVNQFIKEAITEDPLLMIYFEWPTQCIGWSQRPMEDLKDYMHYHEIPWSNCRIDGCRYGLCDKETGDFIHKRWTIRTNDEDFHRVYRAKVCTGGHAHTHRQGDDVDIETYYPWKLVQSICRFWRDKLSPTRHLRLLQRRDDLPAEAEEPGPECPQDNDYFKEEPGDDNNGALPGNLDDDDNNVYMREMDRLTLKSLFEEAIQKEKFTFETLESLMEEFFNLYDRHGKNHTRWSGTCGIAISFGGYSHGAFTGVSNATERFSFLVKYVNKFFKHHQPQALWSSFMLTRNCRSLPHKDHHNHKATVNIVTGFGKYEGGGMWLCQAPLDGDVVRRRRLPDGSILKGVVRNTRHQFVSFQPHELHATEVWKGTRMSLSFYTTRLTAWMIPEDRHRLQSFGFRLVAASNDSQTHSTPPSQSWGSHELQNVLCSDDSQTHSALPSQSWGSFCFPATAQVDAEATSDLALPEGVTKEEYQKWQAQIAKFHKAAGHPTNRNLAKIIKDAGHPDWKIEEARKFYCPSCESLRPGGISSGQVPPASTHSQFQAWEAVTVDSAEWIPPGKKKKVKFLLFMDVATKLRAAHVLYHCDFLEMRAESGGDFIKAFSERWLSMFPRPRVLILDSAKSFMSEQTSEFLTDLQILVHYVAEKEPWANGVIEAAVQDVKHTASAIYLEAMDVDLTVTLNMAISALNATEFTAGYSAHQWAFGASHQPTDEDRMAFELVDPKSDFARLVTCRQRAEEIARQAKAKRTLTKLNNTSVRQPLRQFSPLDLVKVWRKVWPKEQHAGPRGGFKKSGRPHWIGPGRVLFQEALPHQRHGEERIHVVWVLIGSQLLRCSVHSVRPVTETERFQHEISTEEDFTQWRSLKDVLPRREYTDLTEQAPNADEKELPNLPSSPDPTTMVTPHRRLRQKVTYRPGDYQQQPVAERLQRQDVEEELDQQEPATSSTTTPPATLLPLPTDVNEYLEP